MFYVCGVPVSRLTNEIDDLRVKLQHALTELQATKVAHHEQITAKSSLTEQLSLTESRLHESMQEKGSLEHELRSKAELEVKVRELEVRLGEKTRLADGYEDERKQRIELESKVFVFSCFLFLPVLFVSRFKTVLLWKLWLSVVYYV